MIDKSTILRLLAITTLVIALLALVGAGVALVTANNAPPPATVTTVAAPTATPVPNGAMWARGTGDDEAYHEWVAVYPVSTLWDVLGAPSLRFTDHAPPEGVESRSFEIGFYKYGPTWHTSNPIIEFWIGNPATGGTLSIIGNDSGGQLEVRNPADTDHISLDYRDPARPVIKTSGENPLTLQANAGIVSAEQHTFEGGIALPGEQGYTGRVESGAWQGNTITIETPAVTAESVVIVTPTALARGTWWVSAIEPGVSFTVQSTSDSEHMSFNWLVIN